MRPRWPTMQPTQPACQYIIYYTQVVCLAVRRLCTDGAVGLARADSPFMVGGLLGPTDAPLDR